MGHQLTAPDDGEAAAQHCDVLDDVGRQQHDPVGGELGQQTIETQALLRIETGGRLIHDDETRIAGDRLGDSEPLQHAPGVPLDLATGGVGKIDPFQQLPGQLPAGLPFRLDALEPQQVIQHLLAGELRVHSELLRQVAELLPHLGRLLDDVDAVQPDAARGRLQQPGDDPHQRRLPRPVGAEKTEHALAHIEVDALQRGDRAGIDFDEILNAQHGDTSLFMISASESTQRRSRLPAQARTTK